MIQHEWKTPHPLHIMLAPKIWRNTKHFKEKTPSSEGDYLTPERHLPRQPPESAFVPRTDPERDIDDNPGTSQE